MMAVTVLAQQPPRPMPVMTNDQALPLRSDADANKTESPKAAAPQTQSDKQGDAAEQAWNEKLAKLRQKVKDLERRADQAELEINRLRNVQFSAEPRDAGTNAQINARVSELNELARQLRAEAKATQDELEALLAEGEAKKYKIAELPLTTKTGEPNLDYYQSRLVELQSDLRDAEARAQVMQLRINEIRLRINGNAVSGDNFFLGRLRDELQEAQEGFDKAQVRITAANEKLEALRQQARAAGVELSALK
jgi:chromosome segregation ATPase